jgi:hypothetical protein
MSQESCGAGEATAVSTCHETSNMAGSVDLRLPPWARKGRRSDGTQPTRTFDYTAITVPILAGGLFTPLSSV